MLLASLEGNEMEHRGISVDTGRKLNVHRTFKDILEGINLQGYLLGGVYFIY